MASVAKAYITVVPKFTGFKSAVEAELNSCNASASKAGTTLGNNLSSSALAKSGSLIGVFSAITSRAMDVISSHIGDATSRFDTLNNYPRVMQSLGYSSESASSSIQIMSDRLQTLPTRLDDMASTVQGIAAITGDLDQATNAGLALNDMLLASGSNTQLTTAAMEQFRQMLAKGKPDMQDWKSLTSAMPGQMKQLAEEMLGAGATANDLYAALGGGGAQATITTNELLNKMIELDTEGSASMTSFREQAELASGGVATSMSNLSNAVTRGITGVMDEIGSANIAGVFNTAKGAINGFFDVVKACVPPLVSLAQQMYQNTSAVVGFVTAAATMKKLQGVFSAAGIMSLGDVFAGISLKTEAAGKSISKFITSINPMALVVSAGVAVLATLGTALYDAYQKQEKANTAIKSFSDAVSDSSSLAEYRGEVEGLASATSSAAMSAEEYYESIQAHADAMAQNNETAKETIASYNLIRDSISEYVGKASEGVTWADLSSEAQGKLTYSAQELTEQLGETITAQDILNGSYVDAQGNVQNLKQAVDDLCESKIQEAKMSAISANITEVYDAQQEAIEQLSAAQKKYTEGVQTDYERLIAYGKTEEEAMAQAKQNWELQADVVAEAQQEVDRYGNALNDLYADMSQAAEGGETLTTVLGTMGAAFSEAITEDLRTNIDDLATSFSNAGITATDLQNIGSEQLALLAQNAGGSVQNMIDSILSYQTNVNTASADIQAQLAAAGVSMDSLAGISATDFQSMYIACQGNVDQMKAKIDEWNAQEAAGKHPEVDAYGNIIDDEARQKIEEYNRTHAEDQAVTVDANGNVITGKAAQQIRDTNNTKLQSQSATFSITRVISDVYSAITGRAAGGIRPHADGGIIPRYHAGGAIATKAVPLDIVGEAGAEAIVPLTNRKYSQPFADIIAERIKDTARAASYAFYLDGEALNVDSRVRSALEVLVSSAARQKGMA